MSSQDSAHNARTALLLINLGTPTAPTAAAVRPYLGEFLMDPRVINTAAPLRWTIVNLAVLPTRPKESAHAYSQIWTDEGSPLMTATVNLTDRVREKVAEIATEPVRVEFAMRYGQPSIASVLDKLHADGVERLIVAPLYPQYASSSTGTVIERVMDVLKEKWAMPAVTFLPPFYDAPEYIDPYCAVAEPELDAFKPDHILFSFHSVPEDHVTLCDLSGSHCLKKDGCCDSIGPVNRHCYRAQCMATARALAKGLNLDDDFWSVSFQSRLGRKPWLQPYTDHVVPDLAKNRGKKRLAVLCPAFVADCLETLEEIGIRADEDFKEAGGETLQLISCVNAAPEWVDGFVKLVQKTSGWMTEREPLVQLDRAG